MDLKIWEETIVSWVNCLSCSSTISFTSQINKPVLTEIIKKINPDFESDPVIYLKKIFPNISDCNSFTLVSNFDYLCASTFLLLHVTFSEGTNMSEIHDLMCAKLENATQIIVAEFLKSIQDHSDIFKLTFNSVKQEILKFVEKHLPETSVIGDCIKTPEKLNVSNSSFGSPLQVFFETPKKNNRTRSSASNFCGDGDHLRLIKKLKSQLEEEELEKMSLQEQLNIQSQKITEYEAKIKSKIEEINNLKSECENYTEKKDAECKYLNSTLAKKLDDEKKLKRELSSLEIYVSKLETDLTNSTMQKEKLEKQLKESLEKNARTELEVKDLRELSKLLQTALDNSERELKNFREEYVNSYRDEKSIDVSFMNKSSDKSFCEPETMEVVIEKLLCEKKKENALLKETIEELKKEKNNIIQELNQKLTSQSSTVSELQFLNKELSAKIEKYESTEKELHKTQKALEDANAEVNKLVEENKRLSEKFAIEKNSLEEKEEAFKKYSNSKIIIENNFSKIAEDFENVPQQLKNCTTENKVKEAEKKEMDHLIEIQVLKKELEAKDNRITELESLITASKKVQQDLFFENENLKKELAKLSKQCERQIAMEASDFNKTRTLAFPSDEKAEKLLEPTADVQEFNDSLEVPTANKTFDIVNLEEKNLIDTTFSIRKGNEEINKKTNKNTSVWVVSPPSKSSHRASTKVENRERRRAKGDSWVVPVNPGKINESKTKKMSSSVNNLAEKPIKVESKANLAKSSSLSSVAVIEYSPPPKVDSRSCSASAHSNFNRESVGGRKTDTKVSQNVRVKEFARIKRSEAPVHKVKSLEQLNFRLVEKRGDPLRDIFKTEGDVSLKIIDEKEKEVCEIRKRIIEVKKENELLKVALLKTEQERKKEKELYEKNLELSKRNITNKYQEQLEHLKTEMKLLCDRELEKHKNELREHDKRHKEHIDELNWKLWDLREKLLQEQNSKRDLERKCIELKKKYEAAFFHGEFDIKKMPGVDVHPNKEFSKEENTFLSSISHLPTGTFPTIPTEDEEEVFDNRFLEDMKSGLFKEEKPEGRLLELQYRNSLCLPHLKSSYPGETQFHNPALFKENELKLGQLPFCHESQSLTDSDHSMTRSLLPENKGKKKKQTSYKRPGPPTPSKNGGRLSIQNSEVGLTPRNPLKDINAEVERLKTSPNPLKSFLMKNGKSWSAEGKDENTGPGPLTPRRKRKFFRKPFGARDH